MLKNFKTVVLLLVFLPALYSCNQNRLKVDVSAIEKEVEIVRFDQNLFNLPLQDTLAELQELRSRYPGFFDLFTYKVINAGGIGDEYFPQVMAEFLTDTMILDVKSMVEEEFADFDETEKQLIKAFKYYQYHFPEKELPEIYTVVSGFNQSVFTAENIIGISLGKYLGSDCNYYYQLSNVHQYKIKNMHKEKIVSDVAYAWGMTEFNETNETTTLLDNMIYQGKLMYFTDALLPEMEDSLKIGYTAKHLEWCHNNEPQMWNYLIENNILYSNKRMDILRYINDGPYTTGFPFESPARTGIWIGWQIVRKFMNENEKISLAALMENTDYQGILNAAGYYPE